MKLLYFLLFPVFFANCNSVRGSRRDVSPASSANSGGHSGSAAGVQANTSATDAASTADSFHLVQIDDSVNVKSFGAKGDGAADDTEAINNAVKSINDTFKGVSSTGGAMVLRSKELYFPSGTYAISGSINFLTPVISVRSEGGATIKQNASAPIFVFNNPNGGSTKVKVHGMQFLYGTTQITFSNNNINSTMLKIEDCGFHESTDYAVQAIGQSGDRHLSAVVTIENSKFFDVAGVLSSYADSTVVRDSWIQVSSPTLQPDSSVFFNGSGLLKLENLITVPAIADNKPRVAGVHWVKMVGGSLYVRDTKFGGEGAGYPIVRFESMGVLTGGSTGSLATYPYMGSTISIENSTICVGLGQGSDSAVININKGLPHSIRVVNNFSFSESPYIRLNNIPDTQSYLNTAPNQVIAQQVLNFVLGPNMSATRQLVLPVNALGLSILNPYIRK